jgi:predicted Rossmann fold nucleotide-binding protein DprA/Smf involved in DNA uptake
MSVVAASDSQAIALLCAPVGLGDAKPLTPAEWARLASAIHAAGLTPAALVGLTAAHLAEHLGLEGDAADRVAALLERGGILAFELERLESRGIWMVARADDAYPELLKQRLGLRAPAVIFGSGRRDVLVGRGVAVVGSRDADADALAFAAELGRSIAEEGATVVSGAARGVDRTAMDAATESGGRAVGVVADSLVRLTQQPDVRVALMDERLTLVTPYGPEARFSIGQAMGRNKLIYCLSDAAVVVAAAAGTGGTWAGAVENLKAGWTPLLVCDSPRAPDGNRELLAVGGRPLSEPLASVVLGVEPGPAPSQGESGDELAALERYLVTPRTETEVCDGLGLERGRARRLLKRGVDSGRLVRKGRPFRYVAASAGQATLFDATSGSRPVT